VKDRVNKQWLLAERPEGLFSKDNFEYREVIIQELKDEEFLVRVMYLDGFLHASR